MIGKKRGEKEDDREESQGRETRGIRGKTVLTKEEEEKEEEIAFCRN